MDKFKVKVITMARGYGNRNNNNSNEIDEVINEIKKYDQLKDIDMKVLVDKDTGFAFKIAKFSKSKRMKTNQLRKFFGAVRKIEGKTSWDEIEPQFYLLKPRMAASTGRGKIPKEFFNVISVTMDKVAVGDNDENLENFKIFVEFFEAIVAYHKFLGGD